ncbi:MAG: acetyl-CoA carboxylase biotin carboxylase subunit [Pseudomonadota bacterium]
MFKKILIANRGEIAVRIMRTCQEMGVKTVAVYSRADSAALHVLEADQAVYLGPSEPAQSYLNSDHLLKAAQDTGAEAIHPGYGFLAENADFAEACQQAGLVFVGPPGPVIRNLGNKTVARRIMIEAGVPVIPGMLATSADPQVLAGEAEKIGYPVIIKAEAGGGGKGMRIVSDQAALEETFFSCQSEAEKAFGNGALYLEKHLQSPRHIEFQILADNQGNVVHLFERECSIQRRHQKIIEETPSPMMTPELRHRMGRAAVAAARASGYRNAGTVEFLVDQEGRFYFLEVNTRLQVEHPVTELTTGTDLVREQLQVACGQPLSFKQEGLLQQGHAMECRIYAENPEADFLPSPGRILFFQEPSGPGVRNDCGIYSGFEVPMEYDPILSKLIVHGPSREAARQRLIRALQQYVILGIDTTIPFLLDVLESPAFARGETTTDFIDRHFSGWRQSQESSHLAAIAYGIDELTGAGRQPDRMVPEGWPSPWETLGRWRMVEP